MNMLQTSGTEHPLSKFVSHGPRGPMRSPARVLGWLSIGIGLTELLAPRTVARAVGLPPAPALLRVYALGKVATGVGLLTSRDPTPWLWGRVAGGAVDALTVASGPVAGGRRPFRTLAALSLLGGIAAFDVKVVGRASPDARRLPVRDYGDRSGFPRAAEAMRGAAANWSWSRPADGREVVDAPVDEVATTPDDLAAGSLAAAVAGGSTSRAERTTVEPEVHRPV